jgi:peroxiredoxin Q/BCP
MWNESKREEVCMLKEGTKAPDFSLRDDQGHNITLSQFMGKKIVLYFYPKDDTPGCTTEACGLRDAYDTILGKGAVVLGVSADSESSHAEFKRKYKLPFFLVSDPQKTAINAYGAFGEKVSFGKKTMGIIRSTYVIDEKGIIVKVFPNVKPDSHAAEILEVLE